MSRTPYVLALLVFGAAVSAQTGPITGPSNLSITQVAASVPLQNQTFASIAADWRGNVFVADQGTSIFGTSTSVHRIDPTGAVFQNSSFVGNIAQIAYSPLDGETYVMEIAGTQSLLCRLNLTGGTTLLAFAPIAAKGLAIADDGTWYVGGTSGGNTGVFTYDPLSNTVTFLGPGFGANAHLTVLTDGSLICMEGSEARYLDTTTGVALGVYATPSAGSSLVGLARGSLNGFGRSVVYAEADSTAGTATLVNTDATGAGASTLATETWTTGGAYQGLRVICAGPRRDIYWLVQSGTNSGILYRLEETPTAGQKGSLLINRSPSTLGISISGAAASPFVFGLIAGTSTTGNELFGGSLGVFDVNFLDPGYLPVFDGTGIFTTLLPAAVIPPSGVFSLSFNFAALPVPVPLLGQALVLDADSPNGALTISNVAAFSL